MGFLRRGRITGSGIPDQARSILNVGFASIADYRFIDQVRCSEQWGPGGTAWYSSTPTWGEVVGSDGYPTIRILSADNRSFGGGVRVPPSIFYGGVGSGQYHILRWKGNGQIRLLSGGTWSYQAGLSSNVTVVNGSTWKTTASGSDTYVVLQYTGPAQLLQLIVQESDPNNTGDFVNSVSFYRKDDETDYLAGKIFRTAYKQTIVDLNPYALRFMDWVGGNNTKQTRFEYRGKVANASWASGGWTSSPPYAVTSTANQMTLPSATGMPVAMTQGELVTCRIGAGIVRSGFKNVTAITNANPGQVTAVGHGFNTGDIVIHQMNPVNVIGSSNNSTTVTISNAGLAVGMRVEGKGVQANTKVVSLNGSTITLDKATTANLVNENFLFRPMPNLHLFPCTVTVVDADNYTIGVDTTSMGTFSAASPFNNKTSVNQFITLNVGGRGAYPVTFPNPTAAAGTFGNAYIATNEYKTFVFDKTIAFQSDGAGNYVYGVWIFSDAGNNPLYPGTPLEVCTALVNEINAMGPQSTINMWMNVPHLAVLSMDPDHTTASNWAIQSVNVVLNGANGYPGLNAQSKLFVEYSNETWNSGGPFTQTQHCAYRGYLRWPNSGTADYASMPALRSVVMAEDIRASAYYDSSRVKFVLSGQGTQAAGGVNGNRIDGTTYFLNDAANAAGPSVAPMAHHDYFATASYFLSTDTFHNNNIASLTASWISHIGNPALQEADCAAYVAGVVDTGVTTNEGVWRYQNLVLPALATKVATYGKIAIQYEGGWDRAVSAITGTFNVNNTIPYVEGTFDGTTGSVTGVSSSVVSNMVVDGTNDPFVYGYGIPDNTRVIAKPTSTSITLSNATTVAITDWAQFVAYTPQNAFLRAVKRSQAWADAVKSFADSFGTNPLFPSPIYVQGPDIRWGHIPSSAYGYTNTEWGDLDKAFIQMGVRNRN